MTAPTGSTPNSGAPFPDDPSERTRVIVQACLAAGFARAGVCAAAPASRPDVLREWLASGRHGQMDYLTEYLDERLDVRRLLPGARSLIMVADQYAPRGSADEPAAPGNGRIARYARGQDYHRIIKDRLHALADRLRALAPGAATRVFVDTGPVLEREHAARAGLGFIGKHTLLIDPRLGSWLLLGGIATTLDLAPTADPAGEFRSACGSCTRCIDACPTGAIEPYAVNATRCISYLTIEHRGAIADDLQSGMGDWVLGCDVCQEVCPFNQPATTADSELPRVNPAYTPDPRRRSLPLAALGRWTEADRQQVFAGSAGKRADLDMLRRNAAIALANQPDAPP